MNAARYRQEILQPFFEELQEGYFQLDGKITGKKEINNAPNMLENVINVLKMGILKCSEQEGGHFQHFILREL
jgi:hypothetical protein